MQNDGPNNKNDKPSTDIAGPKSQRRSRRSRERAEQCVRYREAWRAERAKKNSSSSLSGRPDLSRSIFDWWV